ncbi:MAG: DUF1599 domain-containing protein [Bacteroidota bacterium]
MNKTSGQYNSVIDACRDIYSRKLKDYSTSWRILRTASVTDQIFIKAQRIRSIEEKGMQKIDDDICSEFRGIVNYCVIALIQLELGSSLEDENLPETQAMSLYNKYTVQAKSLMEDKNHDYGEAWRDMRISSLTDIILMRIKRIKQIEDNAGKTFVSEGVDANYLDMINYAVFALIKLMEVE